MHEAPVSAQLDVVLALAPVQVVDDVVYGVADDGVAGFGGGGGDEAEVDVIADADTGFAVALPDIAVAEVIDERLGESPGVTNGNSLGVVDQRRGRTLAGELLYRAGGVLLEVAADEDALTAGGVVVETHDGGVLRLRVRR